MSRVFPRGRAQIEANLTPMIDMTFLLIVFFVLVSRISEVENVRMELPEPDHPATVPPPDEGRLVLNVLPGEEGDIEGYKVGAAQFAPTEEGLASLERHLAGLFRASPDLDVNLRADRATSYDRVAPALEAIAGAARMSDRPDATRINLVVIADERRSPTR
jgi:biopolymer transport protein ExbD